MKHSKTAFPVMAFKKFFCGFDTERFLPHEKHLFLCNKSNLSIISLVKFNLNCRARLKKSMF